MPAYNFYQITGQAKIWLDRMFPMIDANFAARFPGKKVVSVYAQGAAGVDANATVVEEINGYFTSFGWDVVESIVCDGTSEKNFQLGEGFIARAQKAGETLAG